ncbi:Hypothetical predicted protein [Drosophila guanche]|uniref:Uncharacterized protein n=1 Tax=Drosophila guanche TaxID=7266 RepID=A0A3B0JG14_DROGU|nr:Hypothetical predicted protein [Drosophila guanche]
MSTSQDLCKLRVCVPPNRRREVQSGAGVPQLSYEEGAPLEASHLRQGVSHFHLGGSESSHFHRFGGLATKGHFDLQKSLAQRQTNVPFFLPEIKSE